MPDCLSGRNSPRKPNRSPLLWSPGKSSVRGVSSAHATAHPHYNGRSSVLRSSRNSLIQNNLPKLYFWDRNPHRVGFVEVPTLEAVGRCRMELECPPAFATFGLPPSDRSQHRAKRPP